MDDLRGLSPTIKFVAQLAAAGIAWYFGAQFEWVALGYGKGVSVGWLALPLTVLWIVGVTNVFNFIDGLNGLATGVAIVGCATIVVASVALGNHTVLLPTVALAGALLGFLRYNYPNARIFLGDSGSLSVGFLLAVFSLKASVNAHGAVLVIIPLVAVAVPIMDGTLAILRRWLRHVPIAGADARHIHHRLLAMGIGPARTAVLLWALAGAMAVFGLLVALTAPYVASTLAVLGFVGVAFMVIYGTNLLSYHELSVAGEVLATAPSRVRRVISNQIMAMDLIAHIRSARTVEEIAGLLLEAAPQFGFLAMDLKPQEIDDRRTPESVRKVNWAWKLDYPIRISELEDSPHLVLSVWCSQATSTRPYGAERIARIVGPAIHDWFVTRRMEKEEESSGVRKPAAPPEPRRKRFRMRR